MRILLAALLSALLGAPALAQSALVERPLYTAFQNGSPSIVRGYALFGTLANGRPAITKGPKGHAYFLERNTMLNPDLNWLFAWGLDCKKGTSYVMALGPIDQMSGVPKEEMIPVQKTAPESLPTLRRICDEVDLPRGKW